MKVFKIKQKEFTAFLSKGYPGVKEISDVKYFHAGEYISMIQKKGRFTDERHIKLAVGTANKYLKDFRSVFTKLKRDAGIDENPFADIPLQTKDVVERDAFTVEVLSLIGEKANPFIYYIFITGLNTGYREGDICTLRWSEVDFDKTQIHRVMLKTGKKVHVPILSHLREFLKEKHSANGSHEFVSPEHAEIYLRNPTTITARVRVFLNGIGIHTHIKVPNRTRMQSMKNVHSLRHAFVYLGMLENVPLHIIKSIVGHFDERMTMMYANHATAKIAQEKMANIRIL